MKPFSQSHERMLLALALFGLFVPNGVFLYCFFATPEVVKGALGNPVALVFMAEAMLLMLLCAWLVARLELRSPGWPVFILASLVGSLAFSVPAFLYLASRNARRSAHKAPDQPGKAGQEE
jgi:hypothetical protein